MKGVVGAAMVLLSGCASGAAAPSAVVPQGPSDIDGANRVFAGRDINVYFKDNGSELVVVTFTTRSKKGMAFPPLWGTKYLDRRGISYVAFQSLGNHWWQTTEMDEAVEVIRPVLARFPRITTYGGSMGAHGALTFSKILGAQRVIASAPQFSMDPEVVPWETRWRGEGRTFRLKNPLDGVSESAEKVIIFDPEFALDVRHAKLFGTVPNTHYIVAPGAAHYTLKRLREAGVLAQFMDALLLSTPIQLEKARVIMGEARPSAPGADSADEGEDD